MHRQGGTIVYESPYVEANSEFVGNLINPGHYSLTGFGVAPRPYRSRRIATPG
jgi:hypothetical protein